MLYKENMSSESLINFMKRLVKDAGRKVYLILDSLKVHHSYLVSGWLENTKTGSKCSTCHPFRQN